MEDDATFFDKMHVVEEAGEFQPMSQRPKKSRTLDSTWGSGPRCSRHEDATCELRQYSGVTIPCSATRKPGRASTSFSAVLSYVEYMWEHPSGR
jgi:hypothetical protein